MGIFTRKQQEPKAVVASARRIKIEDRKKKIPKKTEWQGRAWDFYDNVGEVKQAVLFIGNALSKLRIYAAEEPEDANDEPEISTDQRAIESVERLAMGSGHSEMMRAAGMNLSVPGELYLVGLSDRGEEQPETWEIRSVDEVKQTTDGKVRVYDDEAKAGDMNSGVELTDTDFLSRIWLRHPRYSARPDSPLRGILDVCDELLLMDQESRTTLRSRLSAAGILTVPEELSFGNPDPSTDSGGDGEEGGDPFADELLEALIEPIGDEQHPSALAPLVVRGKAQYLEAFKHITLHRSLDPVIEKRTERSLRRLAQGLDVPPEVVTGLADVNHWTAWQIDEGTWKNYLEPRTITILAAMTQTYHRATLMEQGMSPEEAQRHLIWFDPTKLVVRPNRAADAKDAHKANVISDAALLRVLGFNDDDAPDEEEIMRRIGTQRGPINDEIMLWILRNILEQNVEIIETTATPPPEDPPDDEDDEDEETGTPDEDEDDGQTAAIVPIAATSTFAVGTEGRALGRRMLNIDQVLKTQVHTAADTTMHRALERAGAVLRSRANKNKTLRAAIAETPSELVAQRLGPTLVSELGVTDDDLVRSTIEQLGPRFERWVSAAQTAALDTLPGTTDAERNATMPRFDEARTDAWRWMTDALVRVATARLYDPDPAAPELGEWDDSMIVPFGLVRQALARAGGAAGLETFGETYGREFVLFEDGGEGVAGIIATGGIIRDLFRDQGGRTEGFEWDYGAYPRSRPFKPHQELDGETFEKWNSRVLENHESFPPHRHYLPGDHDGCVCDFFPMMIPARSR
jgi:hypothetical protein